MNLKNLFLVAKFEYVRTVKRWPFWLATLFMPVFLGILLFISGYSSIQSEEMFTKLSEEIDSIHVIDETGLVLTEALTKPFEKSDNKDSSIEKVKNGDVDGLIYYPKSSLEDGKFEVYSKSNGGGIFGGSSFEQAGSVLLRQSAVAQIPNPDVQKAINLQFTANTVLFDENGNETVSGITSLIVPGISLMIFMLAVFISSSFLLQSVSEEKENRMIEFILSIVKEETLIYGKIVGLSLVVLTQLTVWLIGALVVFYLGRDTLNLSIDLSNLSITPWLIFSNVYFVLSGFLLFAAIMVGVGAVATSYKDSQGLSSFFIILSILPFYFITFLLADPNGTVAWITSIFPLTSPMVFLLRNSLGALTTFEVIIGMVLNVIYVLVAFYLASRMFNLGALMYSRRPTLKEVLYALRK